MTTSIVSQFPTMTTELARHDDALTILGQMADAYAKQSAFEDADRLISESTRRAHLQDLNTFSTFLAQLVEAGGELPNGEPLQLLTVPTGDELHTMPQAWQGVTYGLVKAFREWMLKRGDAISSINRRLATVRKFSKMATEAEAMSTDTLARIRLVAGFSGKGAKRIDEDRPVTRRGTKRTNDAMIALDEAQIHTLKTHPSADTPQGRRDRLMLALMLDYGLRVSEAVGVVVDGTVMMNYNGQTVAVWVGVDLKKEIITLYRQKVDKVQEYEFTVDVGKAMRAYFDAGDAPAMGPLLRGSRKGGALTHAGMTTTAASSRVTTLAKDALGIHISAHDLRHTTATYFGNNHPDKEHIWKSMMWSENSRMAANYIKRNRVANRGLNISL